MPNGLLGALKRTKKAANTQIHKCVNRDTECVTREDAGHTHTDKLYTYMTGRTNHTVALLDSCIIFAQQRELGHFYDFPPNPVTQSSSEQIQPRTSQKGQTEAEPIRFTTSP